MGEVPRIQFPTQEFKRIVTDMGPGTTDDTIKIQLDGHSREMLFVGEGEDATASVMVLSGYYGVKPFMTLSLPSVTVRHSFGTPEKCGNFSLL